MPGKHLLVTILMLSLLAAPPVLADDFALQLRAARADLEQGLTSDRLQAALDAAWHADDWGAGLAFARMLPEVRQPEVALQGRALRALWRAGELAEAAAVADRLPVEIRDRETLSALATLRLGQGRGTEADQLLSRLEDLGPETAFQAYNIVLARMQRGQTRNLAELTTLAEGLLRPERGYPDALLEEATQGMPDLARAIGNRPINRVRHFGRAEMPAIAGIGLPSCTVFLNGKGPYRLLLDTGGSSTLSLDRRVAEEVGLPVISKARIHGVSGAQEAFHSLIDSVRIGEVEVERVLCHAFDLPELLGGIHGILGTGLFLSERFTLDFETGHLEVAASSATAGRGGEIPLWIVADAKLLAWVQVNGRSGPALIDSGADSSVLSPDFVREVFPGREMFSAPLPGGAGVGDGDSGSLLLVPRVDLDLGGRQPAGFGGLALSVLDETLGPMVGVQCDVLLGMNVLRQARSLTVDGPHCRGWIRWID